MYFSITISKRVAWYKPLFRLIRFRSFNSHRQNTTVALETLDLVDDEKIMSNAKIFRCITTVITKARQQKLLDTWIKITEENSIVTTNCKNILKLMYKLIAHRNKPSSPVIYENVDTLEQKSKQIAFKVTLKKITVFMSLQETYFILPLLFFSRNN